jgi:hypothetical protein
MGGSRRLGLRRQTKGGSGACATAWGADADVSLPEGQKSMACSGCESRGGTV